MRHIIVIIAFTAILILTGCNYKQAAAENSKDSTVVMVSKYTAQPIKLDGLLDEPAWQQAQIYQMTLSADNTSSGKIPQETGSVRLAWDDNFFYVGWELPDSDVVAEGNENHLHHYTLGDIGELFLKPDDQSWYWELYVTPGGNLSTFWFPCRGRLGLKSCFEQYHFDMKVAAQCEGTLNNWQDKDVRWTAEMAVPISELTARGEKFAPGAKWHILTARYNYSRYLPETGPELTMYPQLPRTNHHLLENYAALELVR